MVFAHPKHNIMLECLQLATRSGPAHVLQIGQRIYVHLVETDWKIGNFEINVVDESTADEAFKCCKAFRDALNKINDLSDETIHFATLNAGIVEVGGEQDLSWMAGSGEYDWVVTFIQPSSSTSVSATPPLDVNPEIIRDTFVSHPPRTIDSPGSTVEDDSLYSEYQPVRVLISHLGRSN